MKCMKRPTEDYSYKWVPPRYLISRGVWRLSFTSGSGITLFCFQTQIVSWEGERWGDCVNYMWYVALS